MKKKILIFSLLFAGLTVGVFAIAQVNNIDESKKAPCRKHLLNCPSGWCCGYQCKDGIPTLPICDPEQCNYYQVCLERE